MMESVKELARKLVEKLPEDTTWEQFLYRVYLSANLAKSMEELDRGEGIPHEKVMQEMDEWFASSGRRMQVVNTK